MSTTTPKTSPQSNRGILDDIARMSDEDIDSHVAAVFDGRVAATHHIRLTCACGRTAILPLSLAGQGTEQPWVCPLCAPSFVDDFRAWGRENGQPGATGR